MIDLRLSSEFVLVVSSSLDLVRISGPSSRSFCSKQGGAVDAVISFFVGSSISTSSRGVEERANMVGLATFDFVARDANLNELRHIAKILLIQIRELVY